jgi:hypothetical protein
MLGIPNLAPMARPFVERVFYEQFTYEAIDIAGLLAMPSRSTNQRNTNS